MINFKYISNYPNDRETSWSEELQGVTHDEENWFITQKNLIWKVPVGIDLNGDINEGESDRGILTAPIPVFLSDNYNHFGDLDYFNGHLFVSLENTEDNSQTARIACFEAKTLDYIGSALLPEQKEKAPWCAVNPVDGLLYSSIFDEVSSLFAYQFSVESNEFGLSLHHIVDLKNESYYKYEISNVQGGVFTHIDGENHLYLSSNDDSSRGFHVFKWPEGVKIKSIGIDDDFWTIGEEIEGITYWDLDGGRAPGIHGQIHVLELDNDIDADDIKCFKHFGIIRSPFIANSSPSKKEVHRSDCKWINFMKPSHKVPYDTLQKALDDGYDGCYYCLQEYSTR